VRENESRGMVYIHFPGEVSFLAGSHFLVGFTSDVPIFSGQTSKLIRPINWGNSRRDFNPITKTRKKSP